MDEKISKEKTAFVSNTFGTTIPEVFQVAATPVLSCMLYALIKCKFGLSRSGRWYRDCLLFLIENFLIVFTGFFSVTLLSDYVFQLNLVLLFLNIIALHSHIRNKMSFKQFIYVCHHINPVENMYLTNYKALMHICTAICVLAVDFNIFPRRFAKAEVYGVGVMDMAVGSYIFSNALTSTQARVKLNCALPFSNVTKNLKSSLILVCCGATRVLFIKGSNYQEHVTEYGVHWNFFFTLALIKPLATFILYLLPWCQKQLAYLSLSIVIVTLYQVCLSRFGLTDVIQDGLQGDKSRASFIDANREGLFSCIGYLSLYFCGLFFGRQIFKAKLPLINKIFWLFLWFLSMLVVLNASLYFVSPISRQMANLSYFLVQVACNCFLLIGFMLIDLFCELLDRFNEKKNNKSKIFYSSLSVLCRAINRNLLLYFLLCNVFTGIVNFMFDTINCSNLMAVIINLFYLLGLNLVIWIIFIFQLS